VATTGGFAAHHIRRLVVPVLLPRRAASAAIDLRARAITATPAAAHNALFATISTHSNAFGRFWLAQKVQMKSLALGRCRGRDLRVREGRRG